MPATLFPRRRLLAAATIAALAVLTAGALSLRPLSAEPKSATAQAAAVPVPVATVEESQVSIWDEFSGRLEAFETVHVRSRLAGAVKMEPFVEGALASHDALLV